MREWVMQKRTSYLTTLLNSYGPPQTPEGAVVSAVSRCCICLIGKAVWRCQDCLDNVACCVLCFRKRHDCLPFHNVQRWNGRFWAKGCLWQVGVKIHTGHGGRRCPSRPENTGAIGGDSIYATPTTNIVQHIANLRKTTPRSIVSQLCKALDDSLPTTPEDEDLLNFVGNVAGMTALELMSSGLSAVKVAEKLAAEEQAHGDRTEAVLETLHSTPGGTEGLNTDIPLSEEGLTDDIWEDEVLDDELAGTLPRMFPRAPSTDAAGNTFLTAVHSNGFHHVPVVWCCCTNTEPRDIQLLNLRLYPASYKEVKTVFTFDCLDNQRMENLECKTSIYQFHQKLRRLTYPAFPQSAPNRLLEFRRVSRQWRNLKYRKWFGHWNEEQPGRAEMALFCPACPQPGVNLPSDWREDKQTSEYVALINN